MKLADARPGMLVRRISGKGSLVRDNPRANLRGRRPYVLIEILPLDPARPTYRLARISPLGTDHEETVQIHRLEPVPPDEIPSDQDF